MILEYGSQDLEDVLGQKDSGRLKVEDLLEKVIYLNTNWRKESFLINAGDFFGADSLTYKPTLRKIYKLHKDLKNQTDKRENESKNTKEDFRGAYIYLKDNKPIYIGISRSCIYRTHQHLRTKSHFTSTLAYNIGKKIYNLKNPDEHYSGSRKDFFKRIDADMIFQFLHTCEIAYLPIDNDDVLASFEIHFAVAHNITLNTFRTH